MKPKTFTYNQIIQFFLNHNLPLSERQVYLIGTKVKEEMAALEIYHSKQKAKRDAKRAKRECKKVQKSGSNQPAVRPMKSVINERPI